MELIILFFMKLIILFSIYLYLQNISQFLKQRFLKRNEKVYYEAGVCVLDLKYLHK